MSATGAITPSDRNQIAIDYICPKTAATPVNVRPSEGGTDYISFDGPNARLKCNKVVPLSGSTLELGTSGTSSVLSYVAPGTTYTHAANMDQVQQGLYNYALTTGTAPAYAVTLSPTPSASMGTQQGQIIRLKIHSTFSSGTATLSVNGGTAYNIITSIAGSGVNIPVGGLQQGGIYTFVVDTSLGSVKYLLVDAVYGPYDFSTPVITGFGAMGIGSVAVPLKTVTQQRDGILLDLSCNFVPNTSATGIVYVTGLPITGSTTYISPIQASVWTGGGYATDVVAAVINNYVEVRATFALGVTNYIHVRGTYRLP